MTRRPLRVLQSFPPGSARTNPYLLQLVAALRRLDPPVEVLHFSWATALIRRYDVFHVHWPERLVRGGSPLRTAAKRLRFLLLIARLAVLRIPVVRTHHNLRSHESGGRVERSLLLLLDRLTRVSITLNPFTPVPAHAARHVIPHGDYRSWMPSSRRSRVPGRLLFFGLVRPYKGVEELVDAVRGTGEDLSLHIAGPADDPALVARLADAIEQDERISRIPGFLSDEDLSDQIAESSLVVLPYRQVHNSGAAILALSLDRPVLLPTTDTTKWLQQEVGPEWVITYTPPLTPGVLIDALHASADRAGSPDLRDRDWPSAAVAHAAAFQAAAARSRSAV